MTPMTRAEAIESAAKHLVAYLDVPDARMDVAARLHIGALRNAISLPAAPSAPEATAPDAAGGVEVLWGARSIDERTRWTPYLHSTIEAAQKDADHHTHNGSQRFEPCPLYTHPPLDAVEVVSAARSLFICDAERYVKAFKAWAYAVESGANRKGTTVVWAYKEAHARSIDLLASYEKYVATIPTGRTT